MNVDALVKAAERFAAASADYRASTDKRDDLVNRLRVADGDVELAQAALSKARKELLAVIVGKSETKRVS